MSRWTLEGIEALAASRGLDRLTPEHLARWLEIARTQPDTTSLRDLVAVKEDRPAFPGMTLP